jgi:hypothetical protein
MLIACVLPQCCPRVRCAVIMPNGSNSPAGATSRMSFNASPAASGGESRWPHCVWRPEMRKAKPSTYHTTTPDVAPPVAICPECDQYLIYRESFLSGVGQGGVDQWDQLECPMCQTPFEYRHRTRKLRAVN